MERHRGVLHGFPVAHGHDGVIDVLRILEAHGLVRCGVERIIHPVAVQPKVGRHLIRHADGSDRGHRVDDLPLVERGDVEHGPDRRSDLLPPDLPAAAVPGPVRVRLLRHDPPAVANVFERLARQSAVAAVVVVRAGAVDELLLGEAGPTGAVLAAGDAGVRLERAGRGERPARAALALRLHGRHDALGSPIDESGQGFAGFGPRNGPGRSVSGGAILRGHQVEAFELVGRQIGKWTVERHRVRSETETKRFVVPRYGGVVVAKDGKPAQELAVAVAVAVGEKSSAEVALKGVCFPVT
mmetsp:Transcript_10512/g.30950  ORF Transcript_10512/g.30950 Transcript_10512/m.30950 type:complete len:298 (+) Transcript_10512:419-1312(+)